MSNSTFKDHEGLKNLYQWYGNYHGYVSICVCLGGIVTNTFNVTVLTRRHMRSPVNLILTGLAVSDIITMLSYLPFAIHFYCVYHTDVYNPEKNSRTWMTFFVFHINLANVTHTISIWLCVILAIVRYHHIRFPTRLGSIRLRRFNHTRYLVLGTYATSILVMTPSYLINQLKERPWGRNENKTIYGLQDLRLGRNDTLPLVLASVYLYAILAKLIPCLLISIFGSLLLLQMRSRIKQRKDFLKFSASNSHKLNEHSRTTMMLITVFVLFLVTELPQGVLIILSACREKFFMTVYFWLGDVMDICALVNNAINFVLYCTMSAKFRQTFFKIYCRYGRNFEEEDHEENGFVLHEEKGESYSNNNELQNMI